MSIDVSLARSRALHEAVARYVVGISRMALTKKDEMVAANLTHSQARAMLAVAIAAPCLIVAVAGQMLGL